MAVTAIGHVTGSSPAASPATDAIRKIVERRVGRIFSAPLYGVVDASKEGRHDFAQLNVLRGPTVEVAGKQVRVHLRIQPNWLYYGRPEAVRGIAERALAPARLEAQRDLKAAGFADHQVVFELELLPREPFFP